MVQDQLGPDYDTVTHFTPRYNPWDQRLCLVPDADLFAAIKAGRADVVTDTIDTFTASGIRLASGAELAADIVVTATGLDMQLAGGAMLQRRRHARAAQRGAELQGHDVLRRAQPRLGIRLHQRLVDA